MEDMNNKNKTFIGVFYNDTDLLDKIEELKLTGYLDDNIYVIAKNETDVSMLRSRTAADVHTAYETWTDRFMGFLTGENHVKRMMHNVGMDDDEINRYYEEVQHGGRLLYVDEGWAFSVYSKDEPFYTDDLSPSASDTVTEPSYGGYEPLKNPVPPEVLKAEQSGELAEEHEEASPIMDQVMSSEHPDSLMPDSFTEEPNRPFPKN